MQSPESIEQARRMILERNKDVPFFQLLGMEVLEMTPGYSKLSIAWRPDLCQPAGIMHGGVIASLVDTGIAHALLLTDAYLGAEYSSLVSVDLRIKYLRPVAEGKIYCESTIPRVGRQVIHADSVVKNEEGKEVARGDSIYMIIKRDRLIRGDAG